MAVKILCTGDLHLGRRPAQIPQTAANPDAFRPKAAWDSFVSVALDSKADVVILTGDIVDESNKYYEGYSALRTGVDRLLSKDIPVLAVSGNHDYDVLPRLNDQIREFILLGRGGQWEEYILEKNGSPVVRFQGWSFPTRHVNHDPLDNYADPRNDIPTVGVLHCDCDVSNSDYGPVSLANLKAKAPMAWLLGHIHKPSILSEKGPLILYPGSLQGLDPSETGNHAAWLVTLDSGRTRKPEPIPIAGLRWEEIEVPLDSVSDEDSFQAEIVQSLQTRHQQIRCELGQTRLVGCRLRLKGRSPLHRHLPRLMNDIQSDMQPVFDDVEYFVEKVDDMSRPDLALEETARSKDVAGLLAQRILILESREPPEDCQRLINEAKRPIEQSRSISQFAALPDSAEALDEEQIRDLLLRAGHKALDELLAQKESGI